MTGFFDIHSHFVYGMDDGARNLAHMQAMLDVAHKDGITRLCATPHVTLGVRPFEREKYLDRLSQAREYCRYKGYPLMLYEGAELLYTPSMHRYCQEQKLPTLAGSEFVLLEFATEISYRELENAVEMVEQADYVPVLAHVERYRCLRKGKNALRLKESHDVRYQMNASTIIESRGFFQSLTMNRWIKLDLVDHVASDAHSVRHRPFRMRSAYRELKNRYGKGCAAQLTGRKGAPFESI